MQKNNFKKDFPIFAEFADKGNPFVYLDSAAMAHSPKVVLDAVVRHASNLRSNVHRGVYALSEDATAAFEGAREIVQKFLNARYPEEIVFTRNTTEAMNLVASAYAGNFLHAGDHILTSRSEHHSNFLPWQMLRDEKGIILDILDPDENGEISMDRIERALTPKTRLVALGYVSNVLGAINPVREMGGLFRSRGIIFAVDAAQAVPHMQIDVQKINCDFLAFSGYKIGSPTGIGLLYGRKELLEKIPPFLRGGSMIREVTIEKAEWNDLPWKFEAGTPNIEGAVGLGAAIKYIEGIGFPEIRRREEILLKKTYEALGGIEGMKIFGPGDISHRAGVISFVIDGVHPHDLASLLDQDGICIRVGHHCAQPLHQFLGVSATARASFWVYNTEEDVEALSRGIEKALKVLRV